MSSSPGTAGHPGARDLLCRRFPTVAKWESCCGSVQSLGLVSLTEIICEKTERLFSPTKAVKVLLCVDHSEVVRTTEITCKRG